MNILLLLLSILFLFRTLQTYMRALIRCETSSYRFIGDIACNPWNLGLGTLWQSYQDIQDRRYLEASEQRLLSHGNTYKTTMMGVNTILTIDPENTRTILSSKSDQYGVASRRQNAFVPYLGHGIISSDGDIWALSRRLVRSSIVLR